VTACEFFKEAFGTSNDLFVVSGSGTAAMEAAVGNFSRGRKIACFVNGKFGERLYKIAQRYGTAVEIGSPWGTPLDMGRLEEELDGGAEVVTLVHNETSAGIKNPAQKVGVSAGNTMHSSSWTASHLWRRRGPCGRVGCRCRGGGITEMPRCTAGSLGDLRERESMG